MLGMGVREDVDLAGDVQIVRAQLQAAVDHAGRGGREGPGTIEHQIHAVQAGLQRAHLIDGKGAPLQPERFRQRLDRAFASSTQNRSQTTLDRLTGDQLAAVAIGTIE